MPFKTAFAHHNAATRNLLRQILTTETDYHVVWTAGSGADTLLKCRRDPPDILLVDLALADMHKTRLICDVMKETPCAILILSDAVISRQAGKVFEAMGCGALDAIVTPSLNENGTVEGSGPLLKKMAMMAKLISNVPQPQPTESSQTRTKPDHLPALVAIGASTGGPRALATILSGLPEKLNAAVVICQHVDLQFAQGMVQWLKSQTPLAVEIVREGMQPRTGVALVAGTNDHLVMGADRALHYTSHPREYPYRPSVNTFFDSILKNWPRKGLAILLTGMGRDGAEGLAALRRAGWHTIVQDEKTSVVYGMPAAAVELGGAAEILSLDSIAGAILKNKSIK
jgi:two-component system response regulator WspF